MSERHCHEGEFTSWWDGVEPEVIQVQELLAKELSDNPGELMSQLARVEAWTGRVVSMKAWANSFLTLAEKVALSHREEGWTDLDRRTQQKAKTVAERRVAEIMEDTAEAIRSRLILGMSVLRAQSGEKSTAAAAQRFE